MIYRLRNQPLFKDVEEYTATAMDAALSIWYT